ncbi:MAG TPA: beta-N-acetylhexosaminidase [Verrucomicrobiae bacterium]|nr:beta-N-acetylhexosaminidase [Verrucomicrobiae bacterium]
MGNHLFVGFPGTQVTSETRHLLDTIQPGGVVLFARNIDDADELRALVRTLRTDFHPPPLIAVDQEQGRVNRLRNIVGEAPSIAELKHSGGEKSARDFGHLTGRWLRESGIHMDFAPVLDLELFDKTVDNALHERCWGKTSEEVLLWAGAFLEGLEGEGIVACPKHFPGLGGATLDSHEKLPTISRSREQLLSEDIAPYQRLLGRLETIMVGHGHYPAFDGEKPLPASLSRRIITDLLRGQLGFSGLVLTDDMDMGAIAQFASIEQATVEAFNAGADIILVCHTAEKMLAAHEALTKAVESGRIPTERLLESEERIRRFHERRSCQV